MNYTVKAGDSLSKIAQTVLGDMNRWPEIAALNKVSSPYTIYTGQVLKLPDTADGSPLFFDEQYSTDVQVRKPVTPAFDWKSLAKNKWFWFGLAAAGAVWFFSQKE